MAACCHVRLLPSGRRVSTNRLKRQMRLRRRCEDDAMATRSFLPRARALALCVALGALFFSTIPAAHASAPTKNQLTRALLTPAEMAGWQHATAPAPGHKTFCNRNRHVKSQAFAGVSFNRLAAKAQQDANFGDELIAYSTRTRASRAFKEARKAAHSCHSYPAGGGFTEYIQPVAAPNLGAQTFALREKNWNHVGSPYYCLVVVTRHHQVNLSAGLCSFTNPSRSRSMALIRKAYHREVARLG